jgi:hypothetical protein
MAEENTCRALFSLHGRSGKKWAAGALVVLAVLSPVLLTTMPADAAGNATVGHYLVPDPIHGWTLSGAASVSAMASAFQAQQRNTFHLPVLDAADEWTSRSGSLFVLLSAFPDVVPAAATTAVRALCRTATKSTAASISAIPGIPGSSEGVCSVKGRDRLQIVVALWKRANVLVTVESAGSANRLVRAISRRQDSLLPSSGIHLQSPPATRPPVGAAPPAPSGSEPWALFGSVALNLVLLVCLVVRSRRSKRSVVPRASAEGFIPPVGAWTGYEAEQTAGASSGSPAAVHHAASPRAAQAAPWDSEPVRDAGAAVQAPYGASREVQHPPGYALGAAVLDEPSLAPGWHPVGGDPYYLRYFDGSRWTEEKRWDGASWYDPED